MTKVAARESEETQDAPRLADEGETAEYIGDLLLQLERLARSHGLVRLQYQLAICREEAQTLAAGGA